MPSEMNQNEFNRNSSPGLDNILGKAFKILDDGFVRVVDYLGSDQAIVQAARVSYGAGTKSVHEDSGLIRYLMRHRHTTPFEMCEIKLHVRVPMDVWRQWIRHRTASVNEYSTRYSIAIDSTMKTKPNEWRIQSAANKQGSDSLLEDSLGNRLTNRETEIQLLAREVYQERIDAGIAREQARKDLPLSTYTEAYWKIDLHNLLHFLSLRMEEHAQKEIREYANIIGNEIVAKWVPLTWDAFNDYNFNAMSLSRREIAMINAIISKDNEKILALSIEFGWLNNENSNQSKNREKSEFLNKAIKLGFEAISLNPLS